jgi:hypothetical protein
MFNVDVESLCSLQLGEALRRPSTTDSEGHERPFTQAGSSADDMVGLEPGAGSRASGFCC